MYEWHNKKYLGAAHGLVGIFFVLMQVSLIETPSSMREPLLASELHLP